MDTITINGLKLRTRLGVANWEKEIQRLVSIDLEFAIDAAAIASNDSLSDTVDYSGLGERLQQFLAVQSCDLLETLAERIARFLQTECRMNWLKLKVTKQRPLSVLDSVSVQLERGVYTSK